MKAKFKIVIIGGTGFIGDYLTKSLSKEDNLKLSVIHKHKLSQKGTKIKYYRIDAAEEGDKLRNIIKFSDCTVILTQPDQKLIENITKEDLRIKKIVYASTLHLYQDSPEKQNENSILKPVNKYEESKLNEEKILSIYARDNKTKLCIMRLTNIYGDIKNRGIIQKIFSAILDGEKLAINNAGEQIRDYLFIGDLIKFLKFLILFDQKKYTEIFNICTGKGHKLNTVIKIIESITNKKLLRIKRPNIPEKSIIIGDNKKIVKVSKIRPKFNLKEGLVKTYQNYLNHNKK